MGRRPRRQRPSLAQPRTRRRGRGRHPGRRPPAPGAPARRACAGGCDGPHPAHVAREWAALAAVLVLAAVLRLWHLNSARRQQRRGRLRRARRRRSRATRRSTPLFPIFRAHPLLFQTLLSLGVAPGRPPRDSSASCRGAARRRDRLPDLPSSGRLLYGAAAGLVAALLLALMPYHVVVSRQVLLDGPMTLFATLTLYLLARFALTARPAWLYAAAAAMGLTFLARRRASSCSARSTRSSRSRPSCACACARPAIALGVMVAGDRALPAEPAPRRRAPARARATSPGSSSGGRTTTGSSTRPTVPRADRAARPGRCGRRPRAAAPAGARGARRCCCAGSPCPVGSSSCGRSRASSTCCPARRPSPSWPRARSRSPPRASPGGPSAAARGSWPSASRRSSSRRCWACRRGTGSRPSPSASLLAGSGGLPGGREAGALDRRPRAAGGAVHDDRPVDGEHRASSTGTARRTGCRSAPTRSTATRPTSRCVNPDQAIRDSEIQYVVWDAFSASRSPFFSRSLLRYAERYHGRVVHAETLPARTADGPHRAASPAIVVYEVRP